MQKYNIDSKKVTFVNIGGSTEIFKALQTGAIDAGIAPVQYTETYTVCCPKVIPYQCKRIVPVCVPCCENYTCCRMVPCTRVSATVSSQSRRKAFCSSRLAKHLPLRALSWT